MSVSFALTWAAISIASMIACYRIGINEERARWKRRISRKLHRRILLAEREEREIQQGYEMEGYER